METLKPCPFCGGQAEYIYRTDMFEKSMCPVAIKCGKCGASAREIVVSNEYCAKDLAAEAWNRRTNNE